LRYDKKQWCDTTAMEYNNGFDKGFTLAFGFGQEGHYHFKRSQVNRWTVACLFP